MRNYKCSDGLHYYNRMAYWANIDKFHYYNAINFWGLNSLHISGQHWFNLLIPANHFNSSSVDGFTILEFKTHSKVSLATYFLQIYITLVYIIKMLQGHIIYKRQIL